MPGDPEGVEPVVLVQGLGTPGRSLGEIGKGKRKKNRSEKPTGAKLGTLQLGNGSVPGPIKPGFWKKATQSKGGPHDPGTSRGSARGRFYLVCAATFYEEKGNEKGTRS